MKNASTSLIKTLEFCPKSFWDSEKIMFKDCGLKFLLNHNPQLSSLIEEITPFLNNKKYITFDYQEINNVKSSVNSCQDISWHTDGNDNQYLISCWGNKRTLFINQEYETFLNNPKDLKQASLSLPSIELQDGSLYQYDSRTVHRGQVLHKGESRIFFRVCMSDYISPKNRIFK